MEQYVLFKPNKKVTGSLISFKVSADKKGEPCLWVNLVKQASWSNGVGSFSANAKNREKTLNAKFNLLEIAGIIRAIEERANFTAYHGFDSGSLQVSLSYSKKEYNGKQIEGFYLNFTRNGSDKFIVTLSRDTEAFGLAKFLEARAFVAPAVKYLDSVENFENNIKPNKQNNSPAQQESVKEEREEKKEEKEKEEEEENPFSPSDSGSGAIEESPF
jgi:hypothetical protein